MAEKVKSEARTRSTKDAFRESHALVATWIPTEHVSILQRAADGNKVTLAAYLRAIIVDALEEEDRLYNPDSTSRLSV